MSKPFSFSEHRIVNTITAAPLLKLMLALDGMEEPGEARESWETFKRFAAVPSASEHDVLAFQVGWTAMERADPLLSVSFVRQLTDDATGYGESTRAIQLEYGYGERLLSVPEPVELWSDEFADLGEFFAAVEEQPQFEFLLSTPPTFTGVFVREADEGEYEEDAP